MLEISWDNMIKERESTESSFPIIPTKARATCVKSPIVFRLEQMKIDLNYAALVGTEELPVRILG